MSKSEHFTRWTLSRDEFHDNLLRGWFSVLGEKFSDNFARERKIIKLDLLPNGGAVVEIASK